MKIIEVLVEKALAESKRLKNAANTATQVAVDLGRLAFQVALLAREMQRVALTVEEHNKALNYIMRNQRELYNELVGSSIDTSLPNVGGMSPIAPKKNDKDKPN